MLDNLSSSKKSPVRELLEENISLNRKNRLLMSGLIGLSALSLLSINSCSKNASSLAQARSEISGLTEKATLSQKKAFDLSSENQKLKGYSETAQSFALGIRPWYDENDSGCEDPNCSACQKMEKENEKKYTAYTNALDTLNIDAKTLKVLQSGYER